MLQLKGDVTRIEEIQEEGVVSVLEIGKDRLSAVITRADLPNFRATHRFDPISRRAEYHESNSPNNVHQVVVFSASGCLAYNDYRSARSADQRSTNITATARCDAAGRVIHQDERAPGGKSIRTLNLTWSADGKTVSVIERGRNWMRKFTERTQESVEQGAVVTRTTRTVAGQRSVKTVTEVRDAQGNWISRLTHDTAASACPQTADAALCPPDAQPMSLFELRQIVYR